MGPIDILVSGAAGNFLAVGVCWPRRFGRIATTTRRIQAAGGAVRTKVRDRSRAAGRHAHQIGFKLCSRSAAGRDKALAAVAG